MPHEKEVPIGIYSWFMKHIEKEGGTVPWDKTHDALCYQCLIFGDENIKTLTDKYTHDDQMPEDCISGGKCVRLKIGHTSGQYFQKHEKTVLKYVDDRLKLYDSGNPVNLKGIMISYPELKNQVYLVVKERYTAIRAENPVDTRLLSIEPFLMEYYNEQVTAVHRHIIFHQ